MPSRFTAYPRPAYTSGDPNELTGPPDRHATRSAAPFNSTRTASCDAFSLDPTTTSPPPAGVGDATVFPVSPVGEHPVGGGDRGRGRLAHVVRRLHPLGAGERLPPEGFPGAEVEAQDVEGVLELPLDGGDEHLVLPDDGAGLAVPREVGGPGDVL